MLDILDRNGRVVAVLMDDGSLVRKMESEDDINKLIRKKLAKMAKERK